MEKIMKVFWNKGWVDSDIPEKRFDPVVVGHEACCAGMNNLLHMVEAEVNPWDNASPWVHKMLRLSVDQSSKTKEVVAGAYMRTMHDNSLSITTCPVCGAKITAVKVDDFASDNDESVEEAA